jgi:DNA topoisomerase II
MATASAAAAPAVASKKRGAEGAAAAGPASKRTVEATYQKLTTVEHILLRPDTYIGSVEPTTGDAWVVDGASGGFVRRAVTVVPGLLKCFDELLTNAQDNRARDASTNRIEVTVGPDYVRVWNNGPGIPVVVHALHGLYVPEMVFGHLLTSSNFNDEDDRAGAGRNGLGAKQANIFGRKFTVECNDAAGAGRRLVQTWEGNMQTRHDPVVTKAKGKHDYTCVTWWPDFARFKLGPEFDADTTAVITKRVYDAAGTSGKGLRIYLNGALLPVGSFREYVGLYVHRRAAVASPHEAGPDDDDDSASVADAEDEADAGVHDDAAESAEAPKPKAARKAPAPFPFVYERLNDKWEVAVGLADTVWGPEGGPGVQVSFANGVCTTRGGVHVDAVLTPLAEAAAAKCAKATKGAKPLPAKAVKDAMAVFVNAVVSNPTFDSQTKELLTAPRGKALGLPDMPPRVLATLLGRLGLAEVLATAASAAETKTLAKASGSKRASVVGIPKLEDAARAGTARSKDCTLIITEGDSAKALAIGGLAVVGRELYGVFPVRGKMKNVREVSAGAAMANVEVAALVAILGLQWGKTYTDTASLRYGHVMIMADQDVDGSHIKGLLINCLHTFWPSLLALPGFLCQFITPLLKVTLRENHVVPFFTAEAYEAWVKDHPGVVLQGVKYYKGLGTSSSLEGREYFRALDVHRIPFVYGGAGAGGPAAGAGAAGPAPPDDSADDAALQLAFAKGKADERKAWLTAACATPPAPLAFGTSGMTLTIKDFVHRELVHFSMEDNARSLPSVMDGLKPSQRKILFGCFKRKLRQEVKVAQLAGYVAEHSAYHHGEQSLCSTIVKMAQNFVGSNNVNLLYPSGQFGTRLEGGGDAASPRYIFTRLEPVTRAVFPPADDALMESLVEEGQTIEPVWYAPVVPMLLVNGAAGVGTGWSTSVPRYNPRDVVAVVRARLVGGPAGACPPLKPWYRGFRGVIVQHGADPSLFFTRGVATYDAASATVTITELPVGRWTATYKQWLTAGLLATAEAARKGPEEAPAGAKPPKPASARKASAPAAPDDATGPEEEDGGFGPLTAAPPGLIKAYSDHLCTDTVVHIEVTVGPVFAAAFASAADPVEAVTRAFALETKLRTSNMHAFDPRGVIHKYGTPEDVVDAFLPERLAVYAKRKAVAEGAAEAAIAGLTERAAFVTAVVQGTLVVHGRGRAAVVADMVAAGFQPRAVAPKASRAQQGSDAEGSDAEPDGDGGGGGGGRAEEVPLAGFQHLLGIPLWQFTAEAAARLLAKRDAAVGELAALRAQTPTDFWLKDLGHLEEALQAVDDAAASATRKEAAQVASAKTKAGGATKPPKVRAAPKAPKATKAPKAPGGKPPKATQVK